MVAVINNQGGFYRTEVYVHEENVRWYYQHSLCQVNVKLLYMELTST
jgi:hypothetical protein